MNEHTVRAALKAAKSLESRLYWQEVLRTVQRERLEELLAHFKDKR